MSHWRAWPLVVCEYNAWDRYTIQVLRPDALRVVLRPGESGVRVLSGIPRSARLVLAHVNLSRTEGIISGEAELWTSLRRRGATVLNGDATDICKRTLHERCEALGLPSARASREGPADERLVVKTDLNYGGAPELDVIRKLGARAERFAAILKAASATSTQYRVYRRRDVPPACWDDPALVVERFIENRHGVFFRIYVVGPAICVSEVWSDDDIKKLSLPVRARVNHLSWTAMDDESAAAPGDTVGRVAALTRRVFRAMGTDFGAGDCVMGDDGELVVVDVNKTPYWGTDVRPDIIRHLRRGLDHLVSGG